MPEQRSAASARPPPFLLGTAIADWARANVIVYAAHFGFGLVFVLGYYGLFVAAGQHDWWLGARCSG